MLMISLAISSAASSTTAVIGMPKRDAASRTFSITDGLNFTLNFFFFKYCANCLPLHSR